MSSKSGPAVVSAVSAVAMRAPMRESAPAIARITVPCETPNIVESKSFKLYLNSFNNTAFASADEVRERLRADLSEAVWRGAPSASQVGVRLVLPADFDREPLHELDGVDLDRLCPTATLEG